MNKSVQFSDSFALKPDNTTMPTPINRYLDSFLVSTLIRLRFKILRACLLALTASTVACTPTLNWREVRFEAADGTTLKANLPCKPDTATRKQTLGELVVELSMMGCLVNDSTYTLSRIPVQNPLSAPKILAAWQASAQTNIKAAPTTKASATVVKGAAEWPPAMKMTLAGTQIDKGNQGNSTPLQVHMLWFAKQTNAGLMLYQAALYGNQLSNEAISTFFESLQLQ